MRISDWSSDVCSSDLVGTDIAVESDALDPEFLAEVGNGRVALGHSSLSEPHLGLGEGELAATLASPRAGSGQASHGALADHIPLKLRQCGKNAEHHPARWRRSEEHTSELQSLMRISYAVFCLQKKNTNQLKTHQ